VTVWGDLAEIDHAGAADRDGLWSYLEELVRFYAGVGFEGFRCDAAYHVPAELWQRLIATARAVHPGACFFAETLGARLQQIDALRPAGFDFIFNSSKWWDFEEPWCIEQQRAHASLAPSVSFPESHDTPRLWAETGGSEPLQRQRYAFAAAFSAGVMMPVGYELGFMRRLDVCTTRAEHWEAASVDLSVFVAGVNAMKLEVPALAGEAVELRSEPGAGVLVLERAAGSERAWVVVNRDAGSPVPVTLPAEIARAGARVHRPCRDDGPGAEPLTGSLDLAPAEVVVIA
jgi:starch synthase (maltosyl-transferring)